MSDATPNPDPAVTSLTAKAGDKVDNYTIMEHVGAGGTAIVFRGHDPVLNRDVAIKQLVVPPGESGEDIRQAAMAEAQIHKRVAASEPKLLVQYIDTINDPRGLFLITEYVDGPSLEWIIQQDLRPMDQRQALGIIAATAKALDALHNSGVVHRDLKPSNILMPREGGLKLADFGLAAVISEQQTMDLGSVRYMAPEALQGEPATPKSDLYSLGIIAYEILAGRERFNDAFRTILRDQRNQSMRWVKWHTNARAKVAPLDQLVSEIPPSLAQLVARMMEKDPARRVGSASELIDAIRTHFAQQGQEQHVPGPHAAMAPPQIDDTSQTAQIPQTSKWPIILAATFVLWVAVIGGFFFWKGQQDADAQAQRLADMLDDLERGEQLIDGREYAQARDLFMEIPTKHASEFDADNPRYRDAWAEAGQLKAAALLAEVDDSDYQAALGFAQEYKQVMSASWARAPDGLETSLSLTDAENLVNKYTRLAAFEEILARIDGLLEEVELDSAIASIRAARDDNEDTLTANQREALEEREADYFEMRDDERILTLLAQARRHKESGELDLALNVLINERDAREEEGQDVDERVQTRLDTYSRDAMIQSREQAVQIARDEGTERELLTALRNLQEVKPSPEEAQEIVDLQVGMLLEQAETALAEGLTERATDLMAQVTALDPNNSQVRRMLGSIENERLMEQAHSQGDRHLANGDFQAAIQQYRLALQYGSDPDGRINAKINDATGRIHLANCEEAIQAGDIARAQVEADAAQAAHGDTAAIRSLQARIDNQREFNELIAAGNANFTNEEFGRAKAMYLRAREIFDNDQVTQLIRNCDFGIWLSQCDREIEARNWSAAEAALNRAEDIQTNEETAIRRRQIETRIQ